MIENEFAKILGLAMESFNTLTKELFSAAPSPRGYIYHYTGAKGLQSIIKRVSDNCSSLNGNPPDCGEIRLTHFSYLNDTSEIKYANELISECIGEKTKQFPQLRNKLDELKAQFAQLREDTIKGIGDLPIYIASFSKIPDSLNMWSYYSKSKRGSGYCIKFDYNRFAKTLGVINEGTRFMSVVYDRDQQSKIINCTLDILLSLNDFVTKLTPKSGANTDRMLELYFAILKQPSVFFKHPAYAAEEEFRVICCNPEPARVYIEERNDYFIPYVVMKYDRTSISGIMTSPTSNRDTVAYGLRTLLKKNGLDCPIEHSQIPYRNM